MNGTYLPEFLSPTLLAHGELFGVLNFIHLPAFVVHELVLRSCHLPLVSRPVRFSLFCFNFC